MVLAMRQYIAWVKEQNICLYASNYSCVFERRRRCMVVWRHTSLQNTNFFCTRLRKESMTLYENFFFFLLKEKKTCRSCVASTSCWTQKKKGCVYVTWRKGRSKKKHRRRAHVEKEVEEKSEKEGRRKYGEKSWAQSHFCLTNAISQGREKKVFYIFFLHPRVSSCVLLLIL